MKTLALSLVLAFGLTAPTAASIYPMMGGSPMRQARGLQASAVQGPLALHWKMASTVLGSPLSSPIILEDRVIYAGTYGFSCVDRSNGHMDWSMYFPAVAQPSYDPVRGLLYAVASNGSFYAISAATGQTAWNISLPGASSVTQRHSVLLQDNKAYFANGQQNFICLDLDSHQELWRYTLPVAQGINTAALNQGRIFLSGYAGHLACLDAQSGLVQWTQETGYPYSSAVLASPDKLYLMLASGAVDCRSQADGRSLWKYQTLSFSSANLAWCNGMLIVATDDRIVRALDDQTGQTLWEHGVAGNFAGGGPMILCGNVFISGCANSFYGFDSSNGNLTWTFPQPSANSFGEFAEADGQVFNSDSSGNAYCFVAQTPQNPALCACNASLGLSPTPTPLPLPGPCNSTPDSGLQLWLKAGPSCSVDSQGRVLQWSDLSGHDRNASASNATGATMPLYLAHGLDGLPALQFDGTGDFLALTRSTGMIDLKNEFTVIIKSWTDTSGPTTQDLFSNSTYPGAGVRFGRCDATHFGFTECVGLPLTLAASANLPALTAFVSSFKGAQVYKNAVLTSQLPALSAICPLNPMQPYAVGGMGNLAWGNFKGQVSEILVYNRALSESELEAVESCDLGVLPTHTRTPTPSVTKTVTRTFTATRTPNAASLSATRTPAPISLSTTATPNGEASPSPRPTTTPTLTAVTTSTWTATPSASATDTATATPTDTSTASPTISQTDTPTATATSSPTVSETATPTQTPTPMAFSPTSTATATRSPTFIPSATLTPQATKGQACTAPLIGQAMAYPNPSCTGSDLKIGVKLGCGADKVCTSFYSVSGEKLCEWTEEPQQPSCGSWIHTQCPQGLHFCNGTYFARVGVTYEGRTEYSIAKFVVLR